MSITAEKKRELIDSFQEGTADTGSATVQIALITERIKQLTDHFKTHKKDHHSRYGLIKLVSQRKRLLQYLKKSSLEKYQDTIAKLGLRK